jgi:hypothetical protein
VLLLTGCSSSNASIGAEFSFVDHFGADKIEKKIDDIKSRHDMGVPLAKLANQDSTDIEFPIGNGYDGVYIITIENAPLEISKDDITQRINAEIKVVEAKVNAYRESPEGKAWIEGALKARKEAIDNNKVGVTFEDNYYQTYKDVSEAIWVNGQILSRMTYGKI